MSETIAAAEQSLRARLLRYAVPLATVTALLAGCSSDGEAGKSEQRVPFVLATLDYTELSPDGTKCDEGSPRPCFQPIRKRPARGPATLESIMNAVVERPEGLRAVWPWESYKGSAGDQVKVVCQVLGETIRNSNVWDVIEVPRQHMNNETITEAERVDNPGYGVVRDESGKLVAAYGYAPNRWLGNQGIREELAPCTPAQNPAGHPSAK